MSIKEHVIGTDGFHYVCILEHASDSDDTWYAKRRVETELFGEGYTECTDDVLSYVEKSNRVYELHKSFSLEEKRRILWIALDADDKLCEKLFAEKRISSKSSAVIGAMSEERVDSLMSYLRFTKALCSAICFYHEGNHEEHAGAAAEASGVVDTFAHTPQLMAVKLMEFNRDFSDDEAEIEAESVSVAEQFERLQKSAEYNGLAHHLDMMFADEVFSLEDNVSVPDVKIGGLLIEHGEDDYGLLEGFYLSESEESAIWKILDRHSAEGCSVRGTRKEIAEEMAGMPVSEGRLTNEELLILSEGMLALIRDVNEAAKLVPAGSSNGVLTDLAKKYQELNAKICSMAE